MVAALVVLGHRFFDGANQLVDRFFFFDLHRLDAEFENEKTSTQRRKRIDTILWEVEGTMDGFDTFANHMGYELKGSFRGYDRLAHLVSKQRKKR